MSAKYNCALREKHLKQTKLSRVASNPFKFGRPDIKRMREKNLYDIQGVQFLAQHLGGCAEGLLTVE